MLEAVVQRIPPPTGDAIRACLKLKGEHNLRRMGLLRDPVYEPLPEPAAPLVAVQAR